MERHWIILFIFMESMYTLLAGSSKYEAVVTVQNNDKIRPIAFTKCSENLNVTVKFNGSQVSLQLRHNSKLPFQLVPTILLKDSHKITTSNVLVEYSEAACFYQSAKSNAAVLVKNTHDTGLLDGQFSFNHISYHIMPATENVSGHVVEELGPDFMFSKDSLFTHLRRKRAEETHYIVQVLLFVDYFIYERWYELSEKETPEAKGQDTQENIKYYFAHIFNDMDLRYQNLESPDFDIRISLSGFVIATTPSASPWTEDYRESYKNERDKVKIDDALKDFTEWVNQHSSELPEFDHAMLFTGLDLYSTDENSGLKDTSKVGQASVGSVCQYNRMSIIEDLGRFSSGFTATHELGHNLGAKHDEENNDCLISDHYIMMPMSGRYTSLNYTNVYYFSPCSIKEISDEISDASSECLLTFTSQYNQTAMSIYLQELPGQKYDIHEQCKMAYGEKSYYCGAQIYSGNICRSLVCHDPTTTNCYILGSTPAAMGTTCGNKKWCFQGTCVYDDRAPAVDENCVFGDYGGLLSQNTKTCAQVVADQPRMCYLEDNRQLCCASCAEVYVPDNPGCEYGDQADWCPAIRAKDCYNNDQVCCETCVLYETGNQGCEYGDKATGCSLAACVLESNIPKCCSTCRVLFSNLTVSTPTPSSSSATTTATNLTPDDDRNNEIGDGDGGGGDGGSNENSNPGQNSTSGANGHHLNIYRTFFTAVALHAFLVTLLRR